MTSLSELRQVQQEASQGEWFWWGNRKQSMYLGYWGECGKTTVMDFVRLGMRDAQPRFGGPDGFGMVKAEDLAVKEVTYREDIVDIDHPDARFIRTFNPKTVGELLDQIEALQAALDDAVDSGVFHTRGR